MPKKRLKDGTLMTKPDCQIHQKRYMAVMIYKEVDETKARDGDLDKLIVAYRELVKGNFLGYVAYTDLKKETRLSYPRIFSALKKMHKNNPYAITFNINRMGENVYVKLNKKEQANV